MVSNPGCQVNEMRDVGEDLKNLDNPCVVPSSSDSLAALAACGTRDVNRFYFLL